MRVERCPITGWDAGVEHPDGGVLEQQGMVPGSGDERPSQDGAMTPDALENIRYPIGRLAIDPDVTEAKRGVWIGQIASLPEHLRSALEGLSEGQLDRRYRAGGWTVRQVTHHLGDEHLNAFAYFKMALTEDEPAIKTYEEPLWAETTDARHAPIELSLGLLTALHARWTLLLRSLGESELARGYRRPSRGKVSLDAAIQLYAWHGLHHTAQITGLRAREGW